MNAFVVDEAEIKRTVDAYIKKSKKQEWLKEKQNYNCRFQTLSLLLEHYPEYPAGSRKKEFIDYIMERHRLAYREGITEEFYKVRHNLLVCRFMLAKPMEEKEICQRLGITRVTYKRNLKKGIAELMIHAFGVEGLPPG